MTVRHNQSLVDALIAVAPDLERHYDRVELAVAATALSQRLRALARWKEIDANKSG